MTNEEATSIRDREAALRSFLGKRTSYRWEGHDYNLNLKMIQDGYALDCAHYSGGLYRSLEPAGARLRLIQKGYC